MLSTFYFVKGVRKVKPYYFMYQAYAKGRWLGRTIMQVFCEEFRDRNEQYYKYAIARGLITLNGIQVDADTVIQNSDVVGHKIHRHEPPVTDSPIKIIHETEDLLVIDKPGGIPVHPAGRYRHNSVVHVLKKERNIPKLFPSNRLDRLTSGLMLICKSSIKASRMEKEMTRGNIKKEYICRVDGEFPMEEIKCEAPIRTISHKMSVNYVHPEGKPCTTIFDRISFNGKTSVVRCRPITGRTHQIRVHLKYLGYPIGNDPLYGNTTSWASNLHLGQSMSDEEAKKLVDKLMEASPFQTGEWDSTTSSSATTTDEKDSATTMTTDKDCVEFTDKTKLLEVESGERCSDCSVALYVDPPRDSLFIWLHAWKYKGPGWEYETELPEWANDTFTTTSSSTTTTTTTTKAASSLSSSCPSSPILTNSATTD
ncbi:DRAP deaminase [Halteromyces radiatus]|uniref:DRAP deaminase n=1 Tax=Halteromyces radiatus TaxID=101107 RepID=UPI00221F92CC|nr:DRAP deaminase [Halteromyces radiatus]KAI8086147.1 DRAP deaminase [Halteromyces radiatus]